MADTASMAFYDSLRVRAEKRKLSALLYDIIVVPPSQPNSAREALKSTNPFDGYEGMIIRKRDVIRLNAFGTNLDDPKINDPSKGEKILNSTYTKSRSWVINQYLLFHEGDTVSSLTMADNERLLRELMYIDDARITILPVSEDSVDVVVVVREQYPYGLDLRFEKIDAGRIRLYDRNFAGLGHDLELSFPYNFTEYNYPGIGVRYTLRNIARTFADLELDFSDGMGMTRAGGQFQRKFVTSETKYAWSASTRITYTTEDLDTMPEPSQLRYTYHDYWLGRSFMLDRKTVTRFILSGRYIQNNVYRRPEISTNSYYRLQSYRMYTGSIALSSQRFISTSMIYSYGRTEDIPFGYMFEATGGVEMNEFKERSYLGLRASFGNIYTRLGYIYGGIGFSTFYNQGMTEQGMIEGSLRYFTPLIQVGRSRLRTFANIYYTRGFNRYTDEYLYLRNDEFVRGFRNDSVNGNHRIVLSLEPVLLTHGSFYGFRFAWFGFADAGFLVRGLINSGIYNNISAVGAGLRIRNDQLVINTIQIRFAYYPNSPPYSETSAVTVNGSVRLKPPDFEPDPPGVMVYR